ncbi:hypothetical protein [Pseudoxanthomonas broegbernensis]|uniref:hypothetical protein n=1 Tax=Pseudoxanthomonas broegbernensis TaxID=83619 RepID=UPI001390FBA3|nr:hypothetical protein [Pseudoxanthomonas broegbernensis]MBB6065888.1 hypothetical protein [Pseudoxanthomonas broegbernensis]
MSRTDEAPAALAAFVRGSERRAWLFLWLHSGRTEAAGSALAAAIRAFAGQAARAPMAHWPGRFWRLVAATPLEGTGQWPDGLEWLAGLAPGPRRALLLRLAAGLDEASAADALDLAVETYRQWLGQACPRDAAGGADAAAWQRMAQAVQQAGRELPPRRLLRIAELREAALAGAGPPSGRAAAPPGPSRPTASPDRRWRWALLVASACAAALAATWWERMPGAGPAEAPVTQAEPEEPGIHDPGPILVEPLPEAPGAASIADPGAGRSPTAVATLADPVVDALELLSWYVAGAPAPRIERDAGQAVPAMDIDPPGAAGAAARRAAWQGLDPSEQARLREAAVALEALPEAERAALQARFGALDEVERRGWRLGPALGADYAALHPLLGYVAADEREPLLAALKAMTPAQRARLAELARLAPPSARDRLRRELLARPAAQWDAWLERQGGH